MSAVVCGKRASSCFEELTHAPGSPPASKRARCGGSASPPPQAAWLVDAADSALVVDLSARFPAMSLEDHMRWAGDVCFSDVYREAGATVGIVDYTNYDDMKYAIRKLDDTEFRNAFSRAYIRVREYDARSRSRSRSRSYSRSHSYSRSMTPRSVSRSVSPVDERSLSRSRSPVYFASRGRSVSRSPSNKEEQELIPISISCEI